MPRNPVTAPSASVIGRPVIDHSLLGSCAALTVRSVKGSWRVR
ncbi:MAG: hypothetical protein AVDCRST_MAG39-396 [uncultured Sphingomonadaceae bacterium]|uniref:Uncharacterized protein n=1 Tax=uncultured Sphingomonadaceae bacterium TaxID=169976 RepID=A0A6J4RWN9_9SPHN|nr:MAG: hypothetical protein AVDCRST_MAG39-396 [uncultured Sphingomonadaceae bacterium]